jgi:hypothetical protein
MNCDYQSQDFDPHPQDNVALQVYWKILATDLPRVKIVVIGLLHIFLKTFNSLFHSYISYF